MRIDKVEWPGICDRTQAWKEGRFHLAQQRLRREVHRITVDFEHLACERGDLVVLSHDIIAVGLARLAQFWRGLLKGDGGFLRFSGAWIENWPGM